jgi:phosphoenolpyruvate-protein kinase (PTS system EI component)
MAGDPQCIPILVGLGVDELSMASRQSPMAKQLIRNWSLKDAQSLARQVLELDTAEAIRRAVGEFSPLPR